MSDVDPIDDRWPQAGDRLLVAGRDAWLAESGDERSFRLLRGYKRAGDILVDQALSDRSDRDSLVFPALFNYRHFVEIALKSVIETHGPAAGVSLDKANHGLLQLWPKFIAIAEHFGESETEASVAAVASCVKEFAEIDASSTTFRYARSLNGTTPKLPLDGIDLHQLRDVMNGIENFFECAELSFTEKGERAAEAGYYAWLE